MKNTLKSTFFIFLVAINVQMLAQNISVAKIGNLPFPISNNAVEWGMVNDTPMVFSFAGIDTSKIFSGITLASFSFNTVTGLSERIPDLPDTAGKVACGATRVGNIIYIIGGYYVASDGSELSSKKVHRYDVENNTFLSDGADIPVAIDDHVQALWRDSLIFVVTGWSDTRNVPNVQIYDPANDNWLVGTALPNQRKYLSFGASGTIIGDELYYFGGASSSIGFPIQNNLRIGSIDSSNPTNIIWRDTIIEPQQVGYRMAATSAGRYVHWLGGSNETYNYDGLAYSNSAGVEPNNRNLVYDPMFQQWNDLAPTNGSLPMDLRGIAKVSDTLFYLLGGMDSSQTVVSTVRRIIISDLWVGADERISETSPLKIYPNPARDQLTLSWHEQEDADLQVFSLAGKLIDAFTVQNGSNLIQVGLKPGVYLFKVVSRHSSHLERIVIQ